VDEQRAALSHSINNSSGKLLEQSLRMPGFRVEGKCPAQMVGGELFLHRKGSFSVKARAGMKVFV
jgi:hypothetical protein